MFNRMPVKGAIATACLLLWQTGIGHAQADTLSLTLPQTEEMFLSKNLQLLSQHYNIDASKALVQQAKLWDNPQLVTDQNVYANNKFFAHGKDEAGNPTGQVFVQVEQLIKTAGKRGKLMNMARTNSDIAQWQFNDVMRNLKQQLRNDFYTVNQLLLTSRLYVQEQNQLDKLLAGMKAQLDAGNIARKDYLRIQALEMSLQQDAVDNEKKLNDTEAELRTLLGTTAAGFIRPDVGMTIPALPAVSLTELIENAKKNNPVYRLQQLQLQYQTQNLAYQKALAVPDVTVGPEYDHNSNYTPHYVGLSINLPLPILNRNQGNIKNAAFTVKQQETGVQAAALTLENTVVSAYNKYVSTRQLINSKQEDFFTDYNKLYNNVIESYRQRQLSLIEFIDYFQAYKDIREKQLQLELGLQQAKEELNFQVGTDVAQ